VAFLDAGYSGKLNAGKLLDDLLRMGCIDRIFNRSTDDVTAAGLVVKYISAVPIQRMQNVNK